MNNNRQTRITLRWFYQYALKREDYAAARMYVAWLYQYGG